MRPAVSPLSRWSGSCWLTEPQWHVELQPKAVKALERMSRTDRERILVAVHRLPEAGDVRRLKGIEGYRLRVGEWRILFRRDPAIHLVTVSDVRPRGSAYRP
jgi:mRNA interferase RelE/StbE